MPYALSPTFTPFAQAPQAPTYQIAPPERPRMNSDAFIRNMAEINAYEESVYQSEVPARPGETPPSPLPPPASLQRLSAYLRASMADMGASVGSVAPPVNSPVAFTFNLESRSQIPSERMDLNIRRLGMPLR
jgi:hypothetical protein